MEELEVKMLAAHRKGMTERLGPTDEEATTTEGDCTVTAEEEIAPTPYSKSYTMCSASIC